MYKQVRRSRIYEIIVGHIEACVQNGTLKPGEKLPPEKTLAKHLGVSRISVREAITTLHEKGVVAALSGRGTFVLEPRETALRRTICQPALSEDCKGMKHLTECRVALEPGIAALAATRARKYEVDLIEESLSRLDHSMKHPETFINADVEFHRLLAEATQNQILTSLVSLLMSSTRAQCLAVFASREMRERGQHQHRQIFRAVLRGDAHASRKEMLIHVKQLCNF
jgi:GntR family transcriptional repressor for pyruvate dehydrogenase complex